VVRTNRATAAGFVIFGALMFSLHMASGRNPGTRLPPSAENLIVPASEENSGTENLSLFPSLPPLPPPPPEPVNIDIITVDFTPMEIPTFPTLDNIPVLVPPEEG
jgi:hypothetical protein